MEVKMKKNVIPHVFKFKYLKSILKKWRNYWGYLTNDRSGWLKRHEIICDYKVLTKLKSKFLSHCYTFGYTPCWYFF